MTSRKADKGSTIADGRLILDVRKPQRPETPRNGVLVVRSGADQVADRRLATPSRPSAPPNSQTAAGMGTVEYAKAPPAG